MRKTSLTRDFTTGSIPIRLLTFAVPFMLSNALQGVYSAVDMIIVGKYVGTAALPAVEQSSKVLNFATMVCMGFSTGGQILVAQALGAGKKKELGRIIGTLFDLILLLGAALSVAAVLLRRSVTAWIRMPAESAEMALSYLLICGAGLVFTAGYNMVSAVLRGMGDSRRPFWFIALASVLNLLFDLLFTGRLGWGVAGAAAATILGQAISFLTSLVYLYRRRGDFGFTFTRENFIPEKKYAGMIVSLGAPVAVQGGFINLSMVYVSAMVNRAGMIAAATFSTGMKIDDVINRISYGLHLAVVPIVAQNIAAGEEERVKSAVHYAWIYSGVFTLVAVGGYVLCGRELFSLFTDDPAVFALVPTFVRGIVWLFPPLVIMRGTSGMIQGIGNTRLSMLLAILDGVALRIGLSWLFGSVFGLGFFGYTLGYALAPYGCAIPGLIYYLSGRWRRYRTLSEQI
ncbi:MAG: MATE family efflux transporter [Oscillibacter sp.]|nr:MATE family efflux transporter [Oscillibacter sp.]